MQSRYLTLELLILATVLAATVFAYPHLPAHVPIHWDIQGSANGYAAKTKILFWYPGVLAFLTLYANVARWLSPKKFSVERFGETFDWMMLTMLCMVAYLDLLSLWLAAGHRTNLGRLGLGAVFLCVALLGNRMGKVRRNFFIGIRTPWTLASERVWNATHRFAGKVNVLAGLAGLVLVLVGQPKPAMLLALSAALLEIGYSCILYKRLERAGEL